MHAPAYYIKDFLAVATQLIIDTTMTDSLAMFRTFSQQLNFKTYNVVSQPSLPFDSQLFLLSLAKPLQRFLDKMNFSRGDRTRIIINTSHGMGQNQHSCMFSIAYTSVCQRKAVLPGIGRKTKEASRRKNDKSVCINNTPGPGSHYHKNLHQNQRLQWDNTRGLSLIHI